MEGQRYLESFEDQVHCLDRGDSLCRDLRECWDSGWRAIGWYWEEGRCDKFERLWEVVADRLEHRSHNLHKRGVGIERVTAVVEVAGVAAEAVEAEVGDGGDVVGLDADVEDWAVVGYKQARDSHQRLVVNEDSQHTDRRTHPR